MSLSKALADKLALPGVRSGPVQVETDRGRVDLDLVESGPVGARVRRVKVSVADPDTLPSQARAIAEGVRGLAERLVPVEIDERLGGGVLRSAPQEMRERRYFEVGLDGDAATVGRFRALPEGGREAQDFSVTHEQLGRLVDDLSGALQRD